MEVQMIPVLLVWNGQISFGCLIGVLMVFILQVWRINGSAKTPLLAEDIGKFYSGDCYIILYTYHSGERKEDYFLCSWFGKDSIEVSQHLGFILRKI